MQPDPSLDTTHATVRPGGSFAPEPHSTHQAATPSSQAMPQAVLLAEPQGEQARPLADPQQEEQAGQQAEQHTPCHRYDTQGSIPTSRRKDSGPSALPNVQTQCGYLQSSSCSREAILSKSFGKFDIKALIM